MRFCALYTCFVLCCRAGVDCESFTARLWCAEAYLHLPRVAESELIQLVTLDCFTKYSEVTGRPCLLEPIRRVSKGIVRLSYFHLFVVSYGVVCCLLSRTAGEDIGIQGNLDPAVLYGDHATIKVRRNLLKPST